MTFHAGLRVDLADWIYSFRKRAKGLGFRKGIVAGFAGSQILHPCITRRVSGSPNP